MADIGALERARTWERLMEDPGCMAVVVSMEGGRAVITSMGDGSLETVKAKLNDDAVQFCMLKVYGVVEVSPRRRRRRVVVESWCVRCALQ